MDIILVVSTVVVTNPNHITGAATLNIYSIPATTNTSCAVYLPQATSFPLMVSGCFSWLTAIHVISSRESWRAFVSIQLFCEFHLCQMWFPRDSGEKPYWNNSQSASLHKSSKRLGLPHHPLLFSESWVHWVCSNIRAFRESQWSRIGIMNLSEHVCKSFWLNSWRSSAPQVQ